MTKIGSIALVLALTSAAVTLVVTAADPARGQTEIRLHVPWVEQRITFVDAADDGIGVGDRAIVRGPLYDEGDAKVGGFHADCVVVRRHQDSRLYVCSQILGLQDGEITIQGLDPQGPSVSSFAVTGGTGIYNSALGDGTWTDSEQETTEILIRLAA